jgi:hypothetical protein
MNTTNLISYWTMSGAQRDVGGTFPATDDIGAALAGNEPEPAEKAPAASFLIKASDDEGWWQPLED